MSLSKIALFAFGLVAVLVAGGVNADAASRRNWTGAYASVAGGSQFDSAESARFDRAKGGFN